MDHVVTSSLELPSRSSSHRARCDIEPNRCRVVVLEVAQARASHRADLDAHGGIRGAGPSRDAITATRRDRPDAVVQRYGGGVGEGRLARCGAAEPGEVDGARPAEVVAGRLQLRLLGEQEHQRALQPVVAGRDVEVEDRRDGRRDGAEEGRAVGRGGRGGVDRDDQMRVLVASG